MPWPRPAAAGTSWLPAARSPTTARSSGCTPRATRWITWPNLSIHEGRLDLRSAGVLARLRRLTAGEDARAPAHTSWIETGYPTTVGDLPALISCECRKLP